MFHKAQSGVTFIELIATIVILGIVMVGTVNAITVLVGDSTDPIERQQGIYIAQSYMDEILGKAYRDPTSGTVCTAAIPASRANYDDVCDYRSISDTGAEDQTGTALTGLENFDVSVDVTSVTLSGKDALRVDVLVSYSNDNVALSGYRMEY